MTRRLGLLLLILVMGGVVDAAWFLRHAGAGATGCRVVRGRFYGPSWSFTAEDRRPLPAGTPVEVDNAFGSVRVVQSPDSDLRVSLRKVVYRDTEANARAFEGRIRLLVEPGATLRVSTNREDLERADPQAGFETNFELAVPKGTPVLVRNEHGQVDVSDVAAADVSGSYEPIRVERVAGAVEVRARHADVVVRDVGGRLALSSRHGDVQVEGVSAGGTLDMEHGRLDLRRVGPVTVQARHGSLSAQEVRGDLEVRAQHVGVEAHGIDGRAVIETTHDGIQVRRVRGEARLKADHGGIDAAEIDGPVTAESTYDDVELAGVTGPIDVRVQHAGLRASDVRQGGRVTLLGGDVLFDRFAGPLEIEAQRSTLQLEPAGPLSEPVLARTTFGDIHLRVPDGSRMALEASSANGELVVDVPGMSVTREGGRATGTLAGGTNAVRLVADHGNVQVASALRRAAAPGGDSDEDEKHEGESPRSRE